MKNVIFLFFFQSATILFAQKLEPAVYAQLNTFRHTGFEGNNFQDFEVGISLFSTFWISPKIGFKHALGNPTVQTSFSQNYQQQIQTHYSGNLLSLSTKIRLTKPEDVWLFIWPQYNLGTVKFNSSYYKTENNPNQLIFKERISAKENHSWLDLAAGIEFYFDTNERFLTSVYLIYTLMDIRSGFEALSFESTNLRIPSKINSTIGLGISIEYCFCKKE